MSANYGHNENAVRLAALAGDAQIALDKVARGEADAVDGWLAYGAALNEGRALHAGDREFGQWKSANVLSQVGIALKADEEVAAMWAAANADQLAEARAASNARTVRGWHDQWKKIEAERAAAARKAEEEEARRKAATEAAEAKAKADEAAKVEAQARAEAQTAADDQARAAAEAQAEVAAAEKQAAQALAEQAEAAAAPPPDPNAAERRKLAGLTREGLEDEVIGLRAVLKDATERAKRADTENRKLREQVKDLTADDRAEVVRRLQKQIEHLNSERWRANEEARRAKAEVYHLKKRVSELEKMGVAI